MRPVRTLTTVFAVGALVAGTAHAAPARVAGGGFYRDGHGKNATKTMLTIEGYPVSNSGRADYTVHGPGKARSATRITLSCVVVNGATAYASGRDASNTEWFIKVVDNGEPGRGDHYGVSKTGDSVGGLPILPQLSTTCRASQVGTRAITGGGNFQVAPAS